jgi:hypothetical protein
MRVMSDRHDYFIVLEYAPRAARQAEIRQEGIVESQGIGHEVCLSIIEVVSWAIDQYRHL